MFARGAICRLHGPLDDIATHVALSLRTLFDACDIVVPISAFGVLGMQRLHEHVKHIGAPLGCSCTDRLPREMNTNGVMRAIWWPLGWQARQNAIVFDPHCRCRAPGECRGFMWKELQHIFITCRPLCTEQQTCWCRAQCVRRERGCFGTLFDASHDSRWQWHSDPRRGLRGSRCRCISHELRDILQCCGALALQCTAVRWCADLPAVMSSAHAGQVTCASSSCSAHPLSRRRPFRMKRALQPCTGSSCGPLFSVDGRRHWLDPCHIASTCVGPIHMDLPVDLVMYLSTYRLVAAPCDAPWQGSRGGDMHLTAQASPRGGSA